MPFDSHHDRNRRFRNVSYFRSVPQFNYRPLASAMILLAASASKGTSGRTMPICPVTVQAVMRSLAASHDVRFRNLSTH